MLLKMLFEALYGKPMFTDLLYPFAYEDDAYLLMDGSLGMIWEIEGISIDGRSPDDLQRASTTFANFLKSLPQDVPMQIIAATWIGLERPALETFLAGDLHNPYVDDYMRRIVTWHEHGKLHGFSREGTNHFHPRTIRVYFTVKQKPPFEQGGLYDADSIKQTRDKLKRLEITVDTSLSSGGINHQRVAPNALISLIYRILNPGRFLSVPPPPYKGGDLRKYMVFNSPDADPHGWSFEDKKYSVISLQNNPAMLSEEDTLSTFPNILFRETDGVSLFDLSPMMLFTINLHFPSQDAVKRRLNVKRSLAFLHLFNLLGDVSIDKEIAREESRQLLQQMYAGEKIAEASYHLCIPSSQEEFEFTSQQIVSYLNIRTGSNAFREDLIAPGIFMRALPFGYDHEVPDEKRFVRRARTATASVIADVAPIYMSCRGVCTKGAVGSYNRRGQDIWFDPFDKNTAITSPHFLITGATGSGKSVRLVDMNSQFLRRPATIFVLDKGNSYWKQCMLNGGQYLRFEGDPAFILDPFDSDFGDDHRAFLTALLANMVTGGTEKISREEVASLSEAVLYLQNYSKSQRTMPELVNTLKAAEDSVARTAGKKLFPFYGSGQYARFFEGDKPKFGITNTFFVAELGDLDMYPDLQAVVVFLLIFYITQYVKKIPGDKILIIDEAWSLFKNTAAVDFLVGATKTFRKYGCAVGFATQQLDDFAVIARAMNMKDNCPNKILLYQEMDVVTRNAEALELSPATVELYKTIKKSRTYSEGLIVTQNWTGVSRVTLSPKSYWIASSSEPDRVYLSDLMSCGMSLHDAINKAATEHPYGVGSASSTP
jgi:type-IV secretion system protein TraC